MSDIFEELSTEIKKIELAIDVDSYKIEDIHIWPIYRLGYYISQKKKRNNHTKPSLKARVLNKLNKVIINFFTFKKEFNFKTSLVYLGANTQRMKFKDGIYRNKFFHKMASPINHIIEYDNKILNLDRSTNLLEAFLSKPLVKSNLDLSILQKLSAEVENNNEGKFSSKEVELFVIKVLNYYLRILPSLKKSNIKTVYVCSYYSAPALGFVIASNKLGIRTIEVQHGPIGKNHLAYSGWNNYSENINYLAIPDEIHLWHKNFSNHVSNIFNLKKVTGNYYINSIDSKRMKKNKFVFLFTLQPMDSVLPEIYFSIIRKYHSLYKIIIRTHPKQNFNSDFLSTKKLLENNYNVEYNLAINVPLHETLSVTKIHFTGFSGTFFEAFEMNIPTLFFNPLALNFFEEFIEREQYCGNLEFEQIDKIIKKHL